MFILALAAQRYYQRWILFQSLFILKDAAYLRNLGQTLSQAFLTVVFGLIWISFKHGLGMEPNTLQHIQKHTGVRFRPALMMMSATQ